jgi:hypothetical protein
MIIDFGAALKLVMFWAAVRKAVKKNSNMESVNEFVASNLFIFDQDENSQCDSRYKITKR